MTTSLRPLLSTGMAHTINLSLFQGKGKMRTALYSMALLSKDTQLTLLEVIESNGGALVAVGETLPSRSSL
jgi:hypothetical protein